jgi:hypothetical protein
VDKGDTQTVYRTLIRSVLSAKVVKDTQDLAQENPDAR